ncbi:hypothetical protein SARC_11157 [Sphaeroforma arctica JP610]|uniref:C2 domain-containing protein n=1 Tax=Sphaeroforma arctica JP610 TaxID=667725 RepID=A0A0L0FHS4_9EUKA|nr:hypothetical protein SARC_11157 [Sphaeroforma arctica JP610]KNC76337.1 hypothetical protein SARC_11157 [Sphaeroforma arctica JP610]|eukprot:XP_014150239.1 hypothetical protein SARC_11157 [Sphaeroforma arctica JP610]
MRNFVPRKEGQISEPFCTIRYDGEPVSTSKIAYREVPIWNERFTFMVHKPVEADPWDRAYKEKTQQPPFNSRDLLHPLHIRVFDYDLFRGEVFLGTVIVPLDTLPANNTRADWYTLLTPTGGAASGAQNMALRLELSLVMNESDAKTWSRVTLERAEIKKRSEGGGGMVTTPKAGRAQPDNLGSSSTHTSPIVGERDRFR